MTFGFGREPLVKRLAARMQRGALMSASPNDSSQPISQRGEPDGDGWERWERLNKSEAEMLLDWLESHGYSQREVTSSEDGGFTVRWRR